MSEVGEAAGEVTTKLTETTKIAKSLQPPYIIDVIARGGFVEVEETECHSLLGIIWALREMQEKIAQKYSELPKGKYRIVLIVEPKEVIE